MIGVSRQIQDSVPTSIDTQINATARMGESIVNGLAAVMGTQGGSYTINVNLDGQTAASVLFDPLRGVIKQKGVALA